MSKTEQLPENANEDCLREYVYRVNSIARNPPLTGSYPQLHAVLAELWSKAWKAAMATYGIPGEKMKDTIISLIEQLDGMLREDGYAEDNVAIQTLNEITAEAVKLLTGE